jgi:hypothetical protein
MFTQTIAALRKSISVPKGAFFFFKEDSSVKPNPMPDTELKELFSKGDCNIFRTDNKTLTVVIRPNKFAVVCFSKGHFSNFCEGGAPAAVYAKRKEGGLVKVGNWKYGCGEVLFKLAAAAEGGDPEAFKAVCRAKTPGGCLVFLSFLFHWLHRR